MQTGLMGLGDACMRIVLLARGHMVRSCDWSGRYRDAVCKFVYLATVSTLPLPGSVLYPLCKCVSQRALFRCPAQFFIHCASVCTWQLSQRALSRCPAQYIYLYAPPDVTPNRTHNSASRCTLGPT